MIAPEAFNYAPLLSEEIHFYKNIILANQLK